MDGTHKQEFHVRSLPTRSVTLFPTRAQVVREIKDVTLKPGANEIIVTGVTPTADEHSIKVEGTGSAIITDITVELLPNRDIFQEIYPDSDSESDKDESEEDEADDKKANAALEEVRSKLVALNDEQKRAKEIIASAESRLRFLDNYGTSIDAKSGVNVEDTVEMYRQEREKVFKDHMDGAARERDLAKEITKLRREVARLERLQAKEEAKAAKEKAKIERAKEKLREKQRRRDEEQRKEKARIRQEREQFWPRSCYTVRISLDAGANFTPGSSRRSSIASAADVQAVSDKKPSEDEAAAGLACDLTLSYVTTSAFWAPSYDLALSSTTNTATLSFDARLTNMTSETWANSKVTLSTSQANFSGLQDDVPSLVPWRLKIVGKGGGNWDGGDIVHSREERNQKQAWNATQNTMAEKPREMLFGVGPPFMANAMANKQTQIMLFQQQQAQRQAQAAAQAQAAQQFNKAATGQTQSFGTRVAPQAQAVGFGAPVQQAQTAGLFGRSNNMNTVTNTNTAPPDGGLFGRGAPALARTAPAPQQQQQQRQTGSQDESLEYSDAVVATAPDDNIDAATLLNPHPSLTFQDSSFEETGLTATYDLPHPKTLKPSPTASKQRIARLSFVSVTFTRTVVPKYKPAAYLRARLRNTSKLTLLKGPTGLTLDGTFLGRSTLPRCSAGDSFSIPLGVDPAIRVAYPKPDVARSTTGVFTKGENVVYTRSVTLVNTRAAAGRSVGVVVRDQVPLSEDEKLRVEVLKPVGLGGTVVSGGGVSGRAVPAGVQGKEGKEEADWGKATVVMKKDGEVQWDVVLNAGRSVKLVLQYEVAFPTGERVAQVY